MSEMENSWVILWVRNLFKLEKLCCLARKKPELKEAGNNISMQKVYMVFEFRPRDAFWHRRILGLSQSEEMTKQTLW